MATSSFAGGIFDQKIGLQLSDGSDRGKVDIDFDALGVESVLMPDTASLTADLAVSGANGLDTGAEANDTWYSVWVISHPTTLNQAALLSVSATSPTMPSGYTLKRRVGWVRNNASGDLLRFMNAANDPWFWWNEDQTAAPFRVLSTATAATSATDVDASAVAPSTCRAISLIGEIGGTGSGTRRLFLRNNATQRPVTPTALGGGGLQATAQESIVKVDSSQVFEYWNPNANRTVTLDVIGYEDLR